RYRWEYLDSRFHLRHEILIGPRHNLDDKTARCGYRVIWVNEHPRADSCRNLFRINEIRCKIFAYLPGNKRRLTGKVILQTETFDKANRAFFTDRSSYN